MLCLTVVTYSRFQADSVSRAFGWIGKREGVKQEASILSVPGYYINHWLSLSVALCPWPLSSSFALVSPLIPSERKYERKSFFAGLCSPTTPSCLLFISEQKPLTCTPEELIDLWDNKTGHRPHSADRVEQNWIRQVSRSRRLLAAAVLVHSLLTNKAILCHTAAAARGCCLPEVMLMFLRVWLILIAVS